MIECLEAQLAGIDRWELQCVANSDHHDLRCGHHGGSTGRRGAHVAGAALSARPNAGRYRKEASKRTWAWKLQAAPVQVAPGDQGPVPSEDDTPLSPASSPRRSEAPPSIAEDLQYTLPLSGDDASMTGRTAFEPNTLTQLTDIPCSSYVVEPAELRAFETDVLASPPSSNRPAVSIISREPAAGGASRRAHGARVTFAPSETHSVHRSEYEVPAYGAMYGMSPQSFDFDAEGFKVLRPTEYSPPNITQVRSFIADWGR